MIFDDKMIMSAMKAGEKDKANTYKLIKTKIQEFKTAKNAKHFDEAAELTLLQKMATELKTDIQIFEVAKPELAEEYKVQLSYVEELLPVAITEDEIQMALDVWENQNGLINQKSMGPIMKFLKEKLPGVDGKLANKLIRERIV